MAMSQLQHLAFEEQTKLSRATNGHSQHQQQPDPYALERPLERANRMSRSLDAISMFDVSSRAPTVAALGKVDVTDPWGMAWGMESPFDASIAYATNPNKIASRQSTYFSPALLAEAAAAAASSPALSTATGSSASQGLTWSEASSASSAGEGAWIAEKRRSVSFQGDLAGIGSGRTSSGQHAWYDHTRASTSAGVPSEMVRSRSSNPRARSAANIPSLLGPSSTRKRMSSYHSDAVSITSSKYPEDLPPIPVDPKILAKQQKRMSKVNPASPNPSLAAPSLRTRRSSDALSILSVGSRSGNSRRKSTFGWLSRSNTGLSDVESVHTPEPQPKVQKPRAVPISPSSTNSRLAPVSPIPVPPLPADAQSKISNNSTPLGSPLPSPNTERPVSPYPPAPSHTPTLGAPAPIAPSASSRQSSRPQSRNRGRPSTASKRAVSADSTDAAQQPQAPVSVSILEEAAAVKLPMTPTIVEPPRQISSGEHHHTASPETLPSEAGALSGSQAAGAALQQAMAERPVSLSDAADEHRASFSLKPLLLSSALPARSSSRESIPRSPSSTRSRPATPRTPDYQTVPEPMSAELVSPDEPLPVPAAEAANASASAPVETIVPRRRTDSMPVIQAETDRPLTATRPNSDVGPALSPLQEQPSQTQEQQPFQQLQPAAILTPPSQVPEPVSQPAHNVPKPNVDGRPAPFIPPNAHLLSSFNPSRTGMSRSSSQQSETAIFPHQIPLPDSPAGSSSSPSMTPTGLVVPKEYTTRPGTSASLKPRASSPNLRTPAPAPRVEAARPATSHTPSKQAQTPSRKSKSPFVSLFKRSRSKTVGEASGKPLVSAVEIPPPVPTPQLSFSSSTSNNSLSESTEQFYADFHPPKPAPSRKSGDGQGRFNPLSNIFAKKKTSTGPAGRQVLSRK